MNWDLFGLLDKGQRDEQKRILAEELARERAMRNKRLQVAGVETQEKPKEEPKEKPGVAEVATDILTRGTDADLAPREVK